MYLEISGSLDRSARLTLTDLLNPGQVNSFHFHIVQDIGEVETLLLWHEGSNGWFVDNITVTNVETMQSWSVSNDVWLDDNWGVLYLELPVD